jgi:hypothetical protein
MMVMVMPADAWEVCAGVTLRGFDSDSEVLIVDAFTAHDPTA